MNALGRCVSLIACGLLLAPSGCDLPWSEEADEEVTSVAPTEESSGNPGNAAKPAPSKREEDHRSANSKKGRKAGTYAGTPEKIYKTLFDEEEVHEAVEDLQGGGLAWQGYSLYLRFRAPKRVVDELVAPYNSDPDCRIGAGDLRSAGDGVEFEPAWEPGPLPGEGTCWRRRLFKSAWSHQASHYLHWNPETKLVHFAGTGT